MDSLELADLKNFRALEGYRLSLMHVAPGHRISPRAQQTLEAHRTVSKKRHFELGRRIRQFEC